MSILNRTRRTVLADQERWARSPAERAAGLLSSPGLQDGEALVISPCNSIHMFGMRFAIDVIFVSKDGLVIRAISGIKPWRMTRIYFRARHTIELPVGAIERSGTQVGDQLDLGDG